jgi:hypothetical protein
MYLCTAANKLTSPKAYSVPNQCISHPPSLLRKGIDVQWIPSHLPLKQLPVGFLNFKFSNIADIATLKYDLKDRKNVSHVLFMISLS